ncbi:MAG: signal peptidase I [Bacteroidetes bacterium]|nr:signal peptidase I [Bacteroidota bacterium]MCZ2132639.1 signal peptidase I [Bacteroidota bacterium]
MKNLGKNQPKLRFLLLILPLTVAALFIVKIFILDFYRISSASMSPALLTGDFIAILKVFCRIEKNDIVAFTLPENAAEKGDYERNSLFIKRVIAATNDTISVESNTVFVNGQKTRYAAERTEYVLSAKKFVVPGKGTALDISPENEVVWRPLVEREGHSVVIRNRIIFIDGNPATEFNLTQDFYFVTGDNTTDSYDSRYWGLLPEKAIAGRAFLIYWSVAETDGVRLGRIGMVR